VNADRFGKHPHVVPQTLGDHVEVPSEAFFDATQAFFDAAQAFFDAAQAFFDAAQAFFDAIDSTVESIESSIDSTESGIHRAFELQNGHRLSRVTHRSIVVSAMTMPCAPDEKYSRISTCPRGALQNLQRV